MIKNVKYGLTLQFLALHPSHSSLRFHSGLYKCNLWIMVFHFFITIVITCLWIFFVYNFLSAGQGWEVRSGREGGIGDAKNRTLIHRWGTRNLNHWAIFDCHMIWVTTTWKAEICFGVSNSFLIIYLKAFIPIEYDKLVSIEATHTGLLDCKCVISFGQ